MPVRQLGLIKKGTLMYLCAIDFSAYDGHFDIGALRLSQSPLNSMIKF